MLRRRREPRRAVDAVEAPELPDRLERRDAVDLGVDRRRDRVRPERDGPVLGDQGPGGERGESGWRRRSRWRYLATVNGTTPPVFSQTMASLPPASFMSTNAIVNWSTETAGVTIVIGTRTTSNFLS